MEGWGWEGWGWVGWDGRSEVEVGCGWEGEGGKDKVG